MPKAPHTGYAGWQMADLQKEGVKMGRQPKRIEDMKKKISVLIWQMMNVKYDVKELEYTDKEVGVWDPLNPKYHNGKLAEYESYFERKKLIFTNNLYENCVAQFMPIIEELQNDFTPKERMTILRMFDKN